MLELSKKAARKFLIWIYKDSNIHLQRKHDRYLKQIEYEKSLSEIRICSVDGCNKKHSGNGYCRNHYYEFCGGKEKENLNIKSMANSVNAAKNILKEGLKIISSGTGDYTGGDSNKTSVKKHKSVKPEAHLSLANG